ncbi:MAG: monovalent cation/H(+) antiporter subunit G [bacterium]|nr:monovalent cation/H(+) antiporter subunit G [bacterium]
MTEVIAGILLLIGSAFVLISAIGVVRFPDVYMRLHAATKAGTLGAGIVLAAAAVLFGALGVTVKALVVFLFLLLTAPVAAHVLGRAAHYDGAPKWSRTTVDELEGRYDDATDEVDGPTGTPTPT